MDDVAGLGFAYRGKDVEGFGGLLRVGVPWCRC